MPSFFDFDYKGEKKKFIDHMNFLKNMSAIEQTFYKKWIELKSYRDDYVSNSSIVKAKIWTPTDLNNEKTTIEEINSLNPTVEYVDNERSEMDWLLLRVFGHTMEFTQTPGRFLKFLITDGNIEDKKYLGVVSISSDVISIFDRDKYIGWTSDNKLKGNKRINNSAIGSCIMPTQPFGYNFLGGKLVACMAISSLIKNKWKELYNNVLVSETTTSLYGSYSMYNRIPYWRLCGKSEGKMPIKPDDFFYETWHHWIQENKSDEYKKVMTQKDNVSGPVKGKSLTMIFNELGIKNSNYQHGYERGIYFSTFYENSKDFLCDRINEEDLIPKKDFTDNNMINWWRIKAISRYIKLKQENRLNSEILFYNKMGRMSYDEAKSIHLKEVGR